MERADPYPEFAFVRTEWQPSKRQNDPLANDAGERQYAVYRYGCARGCDPRGCR
jgi:hypothetical protein